MASSTRLVDYVAIVGFDFDANQRNAKGRILQRFPEIDWPDTSFIEGIEFFCQPLGWELSYTPFPKDKFVPKFFQFVLTDIDVDRHYCACLAFHEAVQKNQTPRQLSDLQQQQHLHLNHHHQQQPNYHQQLQQQQSNHQNEESTLYVPKCIVLISRHDYREVFKNCLSIFYAVHVDNLRYSLETLIGNLLTSVKVPLYGSMPIRFSLSAGDSLSIQPPLTASIPVTSTTVYRLVEHLGINNVVQLFYALLTEHKILFYSQSYTRLNEACQGLISLMYPFKYSHTYIPVLPANLIEFLSTPTPFIIGVHSSLKPEICDLLDVIVVDIDGGSVKVPDSLHVAHLEEPYNSQIISLLIHITRPHIIHADDAFFNESSHNQPSSPDLMDKEIRAVFLRAITQILQGYRSCLTVVRIHPKSLISFHKASFLGQRGFVDNEFMTRLLESMFFEKFVESRGLPYRVCDLFDELHSTLHERLQEERNDIMSVIRHIKTIAHSLWEHENPTPRPPNQKALKPAEENANQIVTKPFPILDASKIAEIITTQTRRNSETLSERSRMSSNSELTSSTTTIANSSQTNLTNNDISCQFVPMGLSAEQVRMEFSANEFVINSARRLEVMRNCVNCIFENKISDARKALPAVLKALKNKANRLALIDELACHIGSQSAILEHQQFDLVVRLMHCALQHESHIDLNGVAVRVLPLAIGFCRKLCPTVYQFAFTCIQDHPVWSNQQFWESSFYLSVEKDVIALYAPQSIDSRSSSVDKESSNSESIVNGLRSSPSSSSTLNKTIVNDDYVDICAKSGLEVASRQLQLLNKLPEDQRKELIDKWTKDEESIVYSQAKHYADKIVSMKVPLDIAMRAKNLSKNPSTSDNLSPTTGAQSQRTNSNGSDRNSNSDEESGFEEDANGPRHINNSEVAASVIKFVTRFIDKVCIDSSLSEQLIKELHTKIPDIVACHIGGLDDVYHESKRLPPVTKPEIPNPDLIEGEKLLMRGLRTYLLPDGRHKDNPKDETIGGHIGGPVYLPAEGAIFVTNYRIIFKGRPCDPFYCEQTVVRSFPTGTITKEKRINVHAVPALVQYRGEGLQLRSNTFQLLRVAFDEEVSSENIDLFRKNVNSQRSPANKYQLFAFSSQLAAPNKASILTAKTKNPKSSTLKGFAKKTLIKTVQKAGLKKKDQNKTSRNPAIVWTHARTKATMLRSCGVQVKGVFVFDAIKEPNQTLYVMTEKSVVKNINPEMHKSCEFIPLDLHEAKQVKNNFVKFLRACVPSVPLLTRQSEKSLAITIESLDWFDQLKTILDTANEIVDLIDGKGISVLLAIEESWDLSPQITSIAQLCLDPYYRTFEGFRALIEKEWISFKHRSTQIIASPTSGFVPLFLQFLDLVHQIHRQFPLSFQFNTYYLRFLAYHYVSRRFTTFLHDQDSERPDGWPDNDENSSSGQSLSSFIIKSNHESSNGVSSGRINSGSNTNLGHSSRHSRQPSEVSDISLGSKAGSSSSKSPVYLQPNQQDNKISPQPVNTNGASFWDYAEKLWIQSPIFFNYYYTPVNLLAQAKNAVLRPNSSIALFKLWDYYTSEDLIHGPSYDVEVFNMTRQHQEELQASGDQSKITKRRLVVTNYDNIHLTQPDGLTQSIGDLKGIEHEFNLNPSQWSNLWSKIETSLPVN